MENIERPEIKTITKLMEGGFSISNGGNVGLNVIADELVLTFSSFVPDAS